MSMEAWYLVQCKVRQESRAKLNLDNQGIRTFLPLIEKQLNNFSKTVEVLFPGYLFASVDLTKHRLSAVNATRGVQKLVTFAGEPSVVDESLIQELKMRTASIESSPEEEELEPGQIVYFGDDVFKGLTGIFQEKVGERRCLVLLSMLNRTVQISAEIRALKRKSSK
ncbi:transcription/translation regulatory transformer protein RfaH [Shewanella sp. FJAT-52076]|uniref:transcription/translation regulatory transformer protein RfaH n=1 Tax=Shewanella sp. FJAT-52076 TaxID=2864202 RepID=UPI001C658066|nr:transcription/translation regulatory transformer protein RfaH [Shewanella sp. FJAT-52076]QYJ74061.1 transcription/translation regulatory transformer protein RfaH [Shewanella sp. FJAT-52076]